MFTGKMFVGVASTDHQKTLKQMVYDCDLYFMNVFAITITEIT